MHAHPTMNEHYGVISGVPSSKYLERGVDQQAGERQMGEVVSGGKRIFWKAGQEASQEQGEKKPRASPAAGVCVDGGRKVM